MNQDIIWCLTILATHTGRSSRRVAKTTLWVGFEGTQVKSAEGLLSA